MLFATLAAGCAEPTAVPPDRAVVGQVVPDFALVGPDLFPVHLYDHQGEVIVLDLSGFF